MKFRITRTSIWDGKKPINDKRLYQKEYKSNGRNTNIDKGWFIEINTLEELIDLYKKYGDLIIESDWHNARYKRIEIYDDYRE